MTDPSEPSRPKIGRARLASGLAAAGVILLAGIYGIARHGSNPDDAACRAAVNAARRIVPLVQGNVAALTLAPAPLRVPDLAFKDAAGRDRTLGEWRGRTVLVNLWATWCIPCRTEMPALDALQGRLGGPQFEVVPLNIDTRDPEKPLVFLKAIGIKRLAYYSDPSAKVFQDLKAAGKAFGMPTTILVDRAGCEIGTMAGPAEWASDDAIKLVSAAISSPD
jgi:thiol-disulfide isomerase/thioredoxin